MRRILLVDDNPDNRWIYGTILQHVGYEVIEANDGEEAVRLSWETLPDLILMDIGMPIMDGWEATRAIKADARTAHIPVVALTAHALQSDEARATEIGFDAFVRKPAEPKAVLEVVQSFVGPGSPNS